MAVDTITPADRIRELTVINADIAAMLQTAGQAITALTNKPLAQVEDEDTQMTDSSTRPDLSTRQEAFTTNVDAFYSHVQSISARLRRQAYALEEAGIVTPQADDMAALTVRHPPAAATTGGRGLAPPPAHEPERLENGGLGKFDIGWLNSRGNKVGEEKEKELTEDARKLLEAVLGEGDAG